MTTREKAFENFVEKGEIARNQHFLLSPQCFLLCKTNMTLHSSELGLLCLFKTRLMNKTGIKTEQPFHSLSLYRTILSFNDPEKETF